MKSEEAWEATFEKIVNRVGSPRIPANQPVRLKQTGQSNSNSKGSVYISNNNHYARQDDVHIISIEKIKPRGDVYK